MPLPEHPDEPLKTPWCFTKKTMVFSLKHPDAFRKHSGTIKIRCRTKTTKPPSMGLFYWYSFYGCFS
jgi:hypothetical protein